MLGDVATFSPLKPPSEPRRFQAPLSGATINRGGVKRRRRWMLPVGLLLVAVAVLGVLALVFVSAKASLEADANGIAKVGMPLGGGKIVSVSVIGGREQKLVPVKVVGSEIVAKQPVPANETLKVRVVIKRPGWIAWLAGKTQTLTLSTRRRPRRRKTHYLTLHKGSPLKLSFKQPIEAYEYGTSPKKLTRKVLNSPSTSVTLPHTGTAGTMFVAAQIHPWETSPTAQISYFPGGGTATAVASPKPGATINPTTPITINFSKPVSKVLGSHTPTLTPATTGSWKRISSHALEFTPSGYGYGLDAHVQIAMPNGVRLLGGTSGTATSGTLDGPERDRSCARSRSWPASAICPSRSSTPARASALRPPTRRTPRSTRRRARSAGATRTRPISSWSSGSPALPASSPRARS